MGVMIASFHMHPATYRMVVDHVAKGEMPLPSIGGIPIYVNECLPIWNQKWQFPKDPFVDYEKSDEAWAKPIGYGSSVDDIGNHFIMGMNDWKIPAIGAIFP